LGWPIGDGNLLAGECQEPTHLLYPQRRDADKAEPDARG